MSNASNITVVPQISDVIIVGTGAAAYNCALHLHTLGVTNVLIVTEGRLMGTSRNTGSDKQTYYKVSLAGSGTDAPRAMAETLFAGGAMDGDTALAESAHSLEEFFHLVSLGVPFPFNEFGEYAGYKTDHDPRQRASSIGPYTSKAMTECLERAVQNNRTRVISGERAVEIIKDNDRAIGIITVTKNGKRTVARFAKNIVFATGGPAGLYKNSVYPPSQFGASGVLARAGAAFSNMGEWQYGMGSTKFRWNLSGSYQQVLPRYVSVDKDGNEHEFLNDYFKDITTLGLAIFNKGYQWPFDVRKIADYGSSLIDIAVYFERHIKNRKVYLDFRRNPSGNAAIGAFSLAKLHPTAHTYLKNSNALGATPLARLNKLNPKSIALYRDHGIDLAKEMLEMDVLAQHHNGGATVSKWWETTLPHLYAIGECAGTHGIYRPGGAALNSGQVGGLRAAHHIKHALDNDDGYFKNSKAAIAKIQRTAAARTKQNGGKSMDTSTIRKLLEDVQRDNSRIVSFVRCGTEIKKNLASLDGLMVTLASARIAGNDRLIFARLTENVLLSRMLHIAALTHIRNGGRSRGGYLVVRDIKKLNKDFTAPAITTTGTDVVQELRSTGDTVRVRLRKVRPLPDGDIWFERVWRDFDSGKIHERP